MREHKYRAWDKERKVMIPMVDLYGFSVRGMFIDYNFIPLEYIGKQDINGEEIYELDFIHQTWCGVEEIILIEDIRDVRAMLGVDWENVTVIGNKFENPELLKEAK